MMLQRIMDIASRSRGSRTETPVHTGSMALVHANNSLAVNIHKMLAKKNQNVFFSPLSVSTTAAIIFCAAEGKALSEILSSLKYDVAGLTKENIGSIFEDHMTRALYSTGSYTLSISNLMLSQKGFNVNENFKKLLSQSFKALHLEVDVTEENGEATDLINDWVKMKTNNIIPQIVQSLNPQSVFIFINAIYFKGTWMQRFDHESTQPQKFYNKGGSRKSKAVDMMEMKEKVFLNFYEDNTLQALQLPYIGEDVAMLLLLPRKRNGLRSLEKKLSSSIVQDFKTKFEKKDVIIYLPRFRLEYTKSLVPCFKKLGMKKIFKKGANLSNACDAEGLFVSDILHTAILDVHEEGSETAAGTGTVFALGMRECTTFKAEHPFAFVIYNTRSDLILFMGRVYEL